MARHVSALKRNRQNIRRNERNRQARSTLRTEIKKTRVLIAQGDGAQASEAFKSATKLLDKAVIHGLLHKNNASRLKSRLAVQINSASK